MGRLLPLLFKAILQRIDFVDSYRLQILARCPNDPFSLLLKLFWRWIWVFCLIRCYMLSLRLPLPMSLRLPVRSFSTPCTPLSQF